MGTPVSLVTQFTMTITSLGILRQLYRKTQQADCKFKYGWLWFEPICTALVLIQLTGHMPACDGFSCRHFSRHDVIHSNEVVEEGFGRIRCGISVAGSGGMDGGLAPPGPLRRDHGEAADLGGSRAAFHDHPHRPADDAGGAQVMPATRRYGSRLPACRVLHSQETVQLASVRGRKPVALIFGSYT